MATDGNRMLNQIAFGLNKQGILLCSHSSKNCKWSVLLALDYRIVAKVNLIHYNDYRSEDCGWENLSCSITIKINGSWCLITLVSEMYDRMKCTRNRYLHLQALLKQPTDPIYNLPHAVFRAVQTAASDCGVQTKTFQWDKAHCNTENYLSGPLLLFTPEGGRLSVFTDKG